jgi:hypothetical protein
MCSLWGSACVCARGRTHMHMCRIKEICELLKLSLNGAAFFSVWASTYLQNICGSAFCSCVCALCTENVKGTRVYLIGRYHY